jgi:hypothetical protein
MITVPICKTMVRRKIWFDKLVIRDYLVSKYKYDTGVQYKFLRLLIFATTHEFAKGSIDSTSTGMILISLYKVVIVTYSSE